jgi:hypothetical protein
MDTDTAGTLSIGITVTSPATADKEEVRGSSPLRPTP